EWLAGAFDIDASYDDIWGRRHPVSDEGLRALLGELGVPAADDAAVDRSLADTHPRYWTRLAEPVVARTLPATRIELAVRVPRRDRAAMRLDWRFLPEDGAGVEASIDVNTLPLQEATEVDGLRHEARRLAVEVAPAPGYHRLVLRAGDAEADVLVLVAPPRCFLPPALRAGQRVWGWAVQLYGLRSARNWGVGDFGDLLALVDVAAARGASAI